MKPLIVWGLRTRGFSITACRLHLRLRFGVISCMHEAKVLMLGLACHAFERNLHFECSVVLNYIIYLRLGSGAQHIAWR